MTFLYFPSGERANFPRAGMVAGLESIPYSVCKASKSHCAASFLTPTFGEHTWTLCLLTPPFIYSIKSMTASSVRDSVLGSTFLSRHPLRLLRAVSSAIWFAFASGSVRGTMNLLEQTKWYSGSKKEDLVLFAFKWVRALRGESTEKMRECILCFPSSPSIQLHISVCSYLLVFS